MNDEIADQKYAARAAWPRLLGALPAARVIEAAERLAAPYRREPLWPARDGLGLLRMRDGCFGEHFHLGEFPLAEAALELIDGSGRRFAGGARVLASSAEYASALAVLDALLAHRLPGESDARALLDEGRRALERAEQRRAEIRERTRVDFSLLGASEGEDGDAE